MSVLLKIYLYLIWVKNHYILHTTYIAKSLLKWYYHSKLATMHMKWITHVHVNVTKVCSYSWWPHNYDVMSLYVL